MSWSDALVGFLAALLLGAFFLGQGFGIKQEGKAWQRMLRREDHGG